MPTCPKPKIFYLSLYVSNGAGYSPERSIFWLLITINQLYVTLRALSRWKNSLLRLLRCFYEAGLPYRHVDPTEESEDSLDPRRQDSIPTHQRSESRKPDYSPSTTVNRRNNLSCNVHRLKNRREEIIWGLDILEQPSCHLPSFD